MSVSQTIRKAIIPVAGLGTRFLPASKAVPKELFPIVDKPILLYLVEELAAAGIEQIVLVQGRGKTAIEDFFDHSIELEQRLEASGKLTCLESLEQIRNQVQFVSVRQLQPKGLGHAVGVAEKVIGGEPFAVVLGDELLISDMGQPSATAQLMKQQIKTGLSTVAVIEVPRSEVNKYGIVDVRPRGEGFWDVQNVIEKPEPNTAPSCLALPGRYIFSAELFTFLRDAKPGRNGEIQLTDAMTQLARKSGMVATQLQIKRYDTGDRLGYLQANIELGLAHPELGINLKNYLRELVKDLA